MQTELNLQAIIASDPPYMAGGVLRLSTIDYPGRLASVIYCSGCPLRCPYCHNKGLVLGQTVELPMMQAAKTCLRRGIEGVVITGGEPMMDDRLGALIDLLKQRAGYVKLDTNGLLMPLSALDNTLTEEDTTKRFSGKPSYVALDVKLPYADYPALNQGVDGQTWDRWRANLRLNITLVDGPLYDGEFRTTVHKRLLPPDKLRQLKEDWLKDCAKPWYLQQFRKSDCFDPSLNDEPTYTDEELADLAIELGAYVRGMDLSLCARVEQAVNARQDENNKKTKETT
jgi:pyruvate formate lyase activating enzyme